MLWLILHVVCVCLCVCLCDVGRCSLTPEQIEFIFSMRVTTEDSYFVLDGCLDPSCETSQRLTVGFRQFLALTAPQLPTPAVAELNNYVHITQPDAKKIYLIATFRLPVANFITHMVT